MPCLTQGRKRKTEIEVNTPLERGHIPISKLEMNIPRERKILYILYSN